MLYDFIWLVSGGVGIVIIMYVFIFIFVHIIFIRHLLLGLGFPCPFKQLLYYHLSAVYQKLVSSKLKRN